VASDSRALTLKLLADVADFQKKINDSEKTTEGFSGKVKDFGIKAGAAFAAATAAAAAYAGKLLVDGVRSAIEDEKAQAKLAATLKNVTGATEAQIKSTEEYILKTSLAFGVTDKDLRPSLERLAIATGDTTKAQNLQRLALDVAAGSGRSLDQVTQALAKAYEGNTGALSRLGIGLSAAELKSKSFDQITATLATTFKDQGSIQADTFQGKISRLQIAFDEAKESIGSKLLPILTTFLSYVTDRLVPAIQSILDKFKPLTTAIENNKDEFKALWDFLNKYVVPIIVGALKNGLSTIITVISTAVTAIGKLVNAFQFLYDKYEAFVNFLKNNPLSKWLGSLNPFNNSSFEQTRSLSFGTADFITAATQQNENISAFDNKYNIEGLSLPSGAKMSGVTAAALAGLQPGGRYTYGFLRARGLSEEAITALKNSGIITTTTPEGLKIKELGITGTPQEQVDEYLRRRAAGELPTPTQEFNITVNGAIDAEGTARQILNVLNQSYGRGTGGALAFTGLGTTF
jgi:hypothetical protein